MGKKKKVFEIFFCERCGHEWIPRNKGFFPIKCSKCSSPYWNRRRVKK